jgi:hypothetical protein
MNENPCSNNEHPVTLKKMDSSMIALKQCQMKSAKSRMEKCNFLFKSLVVAWYVLSLHTLLLSFLLKITLQLQNFSC